MAGLCALTQEDGSCIPPTVEENWSQKRGSGFVRSAVCHLRRYPAHPKQPPLCNVEAPRLVPGRLHINSHLQSHFSSWGFTMFIPKSTVLPLVIFKETSNYINPQLKKILRWSVSESKCTYYESCEYLFKSQNV